MTYSATAMGYFRKAVLLILLGVGFFNQYAAADPTVTALNGTTCGGTRYGGALNCSANDFTTAVTIASGSTTSCNEGDYFYLDANVTMISGNANRYDIAFFSGETGNDPTAVGGQCSVASFPNTPAPWYEAGSNSCGDFRRRSSSSPLVQQIRVLCTGNASGQLQIPYAVTWQPNSNAVCTGPSDIAPGSTSKCVSGVATINNVWVIPQPIVEYRFDEAAWNGTAGEVVDSSTNGYNGTANNGATTANTNPAIAGDPGTCGYGTFNGSSNYVSLPGFPNLTDNFTISAWIRPNAPTASQNDWRIFADDQNNSGGYALSLHDGGRGHLRFFSRNVNPISLDSSYSADLANGNVWKFVTAVHDATNKRMRIYLDGQQVAQQTYSGNWGTDSGLASIGGEVDGSSEGVARWRFNGLIDEVRVFQQALNSSQVAQLMNATHPCPSVVVPLDHVRLVHDGSAVACAAETVTVRACANSDCSVTYTDGVNGTVTAGSNVVAFSIPSGQAQATVAIHLPTDGALADPQTVRLGTGAFSVVPVNPTECNNTTAGVTNTTTACDVSVYKAGFVFDVPNLISGVASNNVNISAVRSSDNTSCVPLFQNATRDVAFWGNYQNPAAGTLSVLVNGTGVETTASPTYTSLRSLSFDNNGVATLSSVRYDDVGLMQLNARYVGSAGNTPPDEGMVVLGSDTFVVKPDHFELSAIKCTTADAANCGAGALAMPTPGDNPAAADATGPTFIRAGQPFSVTVTAKNAAGGTTKNYGQESPTSEGVKLTSNLVTGLGLSNNPTLNNADAFGTFTDGVATGTTFSWDDVGIITLTPSVKDGDYLTAGDVSGSTSGNVGRFYPATFTVTHTLAAKCSSGSPFTYAGLAGIGGKTGESFTVSGTVKAFGAGGTQTQNYTGAFAKLGTGDILADPREGAVAANGVLVPTWTGVDSLTFDSSGNGTYTKSGVSYAFNSEGVPQLMHLRLTATDSDSVTGKEDDTTKAIEYRFGRARLQNAYGTEILPLAMPFTTEYFTANGWTTNSDDGCTNLTTTSHLQLSVDNGATWVSGDQAVAVGGGTTLAALANSPFLAGVGGLSFTAPGAGNTGYVDVRTQLGTNYPWLLYSWNSPSTQTDASGRVNFGLYNGSDRQIYMQEQY